MKIVLRYPDQIVQSYYSFINPPFLNTGAGLLIDLRDGIEEQSELYHIPHLATLTTVGKSFRWHLVKLSIFFGLTGPKSCIRRFGTSKPQKKRQLF